MGFLGDDAEESLEFFNAMKASWGVICKHEAGKVLAHIMKCIDICLTVQGTMRFFENSTHQYEGSIIYGGFFTLQLGTALYEPVESSELKPLVDKASAHGIALEFIFSKLNYADATARATAMDAMTSIREVAVEIRTHAWNPTYEIEMIKKAHFLSFRGDKDYLYPNSHNITEVLKAIADDSVIESRFPLHPEAITSVNRTYRLLSAFGIEVPTFMVPGGKKMSLDGNFTVSGRNEAGNPTQVDVHKVAVSFTDLKRAFTDFERVKKEKSIQNPFGNKGLQNSAAFTGSGMISRFEKDHAADILAALRSAVGATLIQKTGGKRKIDDVDEFERKMAKKSKSFSV